MAGDATTIARPYAEAIFARADETGKLDLWAEMLEFMSAAVSDKTLAGIVANPLFDREDLSTLMLDVGGGRLNDEGANLIKLLTVNGRLSILPEITELFEELKAEKDRMLKVHVVSAYALQATQEKQLAEALKKKLGREVTITSEKDPALIGGVHIRAGDTVIDGSVKGQLQQLANELGI
ncbi:MAG: F0F1 ATP synthase subunit delta [Gammaproteobacteria bacterium]|nr:F0F1 ATP synthase subunit delta [Gammaproteobacteria bacterium]